MRRNGDLLALEDAGAYFEGALGFLKPEWMRNPKLGMDSADFRMAMDAQQSLFTTPNAGIPAMMTTFVDPKVVDLIFTPNKAVEIMGGEIRKGDWTDDLIVFKFLESAGEVSSYGDYNNNGMADVNANFPSRQSYLYQIFYELGDREVARYGKAGLDWASAKKNAVIIALNRFQNLTYFFGVNGLACYGFLNDPLLLPSITPGAKAFGNNRWITGNVITATANEVYADIQSLFLLLIRQSGGTIDKDAKFVLACDPGSAVAFTATNSFNVNVEDLLKKNFPNIRMETAVQFSGNAGNLVMLFVEEIDGEKTVEPAYNEKLRAHRMVFDSSSFKQKHTQGTWGTINKRPFALATMLGV